MVAVSLPQGGLAATFFGLYYFSSFNMVNNMEEKKQILDEDPYLKSWEIADIKSLIMEILLYCDKVVADRNKNQLKIIVNVREGKKTIIYHTNIF